MWGRSRRRSPNCGRTDAAQDAGQLEHPAEPGPQADNRVRQEPPQEESASGRASAAAPPSDAPARRSGEHVRALRGRCVAQPARALRGLRPDRDSADRSQITRVSLHGGVCPCCAKRFKAEAPAGLEPGSPFGPNLRAFVIYLRFTQGVAFERLSRRRKTCSAFRSVKARSSTFSGRRASPSPQPAPPSAPGC